jgi:hypothetical protein
MILMKKYYKIINFSLEVNKLSEFKELNERKCVAIHYVNYAGINWSLRAYIEQRMSKNEDNYIGIYLSASR